jgi:RNA polymerase sigma factor (sigma-70 family)
MKQTPNDTTFERVIGPYFQAAYNYTRWISGNKEEADDVFQEAMAKILVSLDSLNSVHVKSWVYAIIRNTYIDNIRRSKRQVSEEFVDAEPGAGVNDMTPETEFLKKADKLLIQKMLEKLPVEFREVIVLKEYDDMSYKDIAKVLGAPIGTVMSRLARAREKLLQMLQHEEGGKK